MASARSSARSTPLLSPVILRTFFSTALRMFRMFIRCSLSVPHGFPIMIRFCSASQSWAELHSANRPSMWVPTLCLIHRVACL